MSWGHADGLFPASTGLHTRPRRGKVTPCVTCIITSAHFSPGFPAWDFSFFEPAPLLNEISSGREECPLWVISGHCPASAPCLLYPRKQTFVSASGTSAMCHKQTFTQARLPFSRPASSVAFKARFPAPWPWGTRNPPSSSACDVAPIYREWVNNHEACARATEPKNGGCDLLRSTKSPNRLLFQDIFHGVWFLSQHARNHGRFDGPGANRVDANASGGIFERSTLRQPEYSVFGCMIRCSAGYTDQTAD